MANQTGQLKRLLEEEGIDVPIVQTNAPYRPAWIGRVKGVRAVFRLLPYLQQLWRECGQVDVVHVMANSGWAWHFFAAPAVHVGKWRGRLVVVNYRGGLAREFLRRAAGRVSRTLRGARLVVPSDFLREVFAESGMQAEVIPNVVDTRVFRPTDQPRSSEMPDAPHVVIARNLEPIYGVDLGLRAIAVLAERYPGVRVSIAGTGPERESLGALACELGIAGRVQFTGRLDVHGMVHLYHSADVVLNPVRVDNAPNSVLEALACGVPVVSTRVGGVPYLVTHQSTALLVDPESPQALADAVARVFDDPQLRIGLVNRGLARARQSDWAAVRDLWLAVYRSRAA
jgi:glycosyltransferase involved in cell wall biosynthesis